MNQQMRRPIRRGKAAMPKEKHRYIFPNILSKMMKNVSMDVQLESSMMASTLIMVGMMLMAIFLVFFTAQTIAFKVLTFINLIGAFIFLSSALVTTYQQYVSYKDVMEMQKSMGMDGQRDNPMDLPINDHKMTPRYNRKNQLLFFGGLILIIASFFTPGIIMDQDPSLASYRYYIMGGMDVVGVFMMYLALKKKKDKKRPIPIVSIPQQRPEAPMATYVEPVKPERTPEEKAEILQRVRAAGGIEAYRKSLEEPVIPPQPVVWTAPEPVPAPRPVQRQVRQPVAPPIVRAPRPATETAVIPRARVSPMRPNRLANIKERFRPKGPNKKQQAINSVERLLNDKLYEINRLKAQQ